LVATQLSELRTIPPRSFHSNTGNVKLFVLLVGDFPQWPNLSLSHASTHTQQPTLNIITLLGALHPSNLYLTIQYNNIKDTFVNISLGLSSGHFPLSVFH